MHSETKNSAQAAAIMGIIASLLLEAWVIYRTCTCGIQTDFRLYACIGTVFIIAAMAVFFGRTLCSCTVSAAYTALMTVGCLTGYALGLSSGGMAREVICAAAVFLLTFSLTERLLKLLEYRLFLIIAAILSVAVYIVTLLMAKRIGGAALGINILGHTVQVFELGKPLYIIITASVLCIQSLRPSSKLLITLGFTILHCILLLMQSELGTMLCIITAYIGQLTVWLNEPAAALRAAFWDKWRKLVFVPAVAAVAATAAGILKMYPFIIDKAVQRIDGWLNGTYQTDCGMKAMANGGMIGIIGAEPMYIPYADSDMVFPSVIQLFGLTAGIGLIVVYGILGISVITGVQGSQSTIARSMAVGSVIMLTMQALIAVCASTGLIPMTGITLPFVSNGGVSLSVCSAFIGIIAFTVKKRREVGER